MSTATIAAGPVVRPLSAIKADMANALASRPESILADVKAAIIWLPRKAAAAIMRSARFLHVPQLLAFVRRNLQRFIAVVGVGPFVTEMLTSHWGQKTISKTIKTGAAITKWAIKWSWKILTSPGRIFTPTRNALEKVDAAVAKADRKLTPGSGECVGPIQLVHDAGAEFISPDAAHMKMARITAFAVASVRATRRFVPVGWLRVLTYILDGAIIANAYKETLKDSALGRWADKKTRKTWAAAVETDIVSAGENASAEATRLTREAASKSSAKLRAQADEVVAKGKMEAAEILESGTEAVQTAAGETIVSSEAEAEELRRDAEAMEATAERMAAAEVAVEVTEAIQENEAVAADVPSPILVEERPKPGPSVPPMGGRTPSGPQTPSHQRHGGQQKPPKPKNR